MFELDDYLLLLILPIGLFVYISRNIRFNRLLAMYSEISLNAEAYGKINDALKLIGASTYYGFASEHILNAKIENETIPILYGHGTGPRSMNWWPATNICKVFFTVSNKMVQLKLIRSFPKIFTFGCFYENSAICWIKDVKMLEQVLKENRNNGVR